MTINGTTRTLAIAASTDGKRYSKFPNGTLPQVVTVLNAHGWGQTVTSGGTITGPAPLAIHFDAIGTQGVPATDIFREHGYHFNFGDSEAGNWTHSGEPRVSYIGGPVTAHNYLTPGTYTAKVRSQDADASYDDAQVTIVVQDPDVVYANTATVCLHWGGAASGGPSGCSYRDVSTLGWPTWAADTRYLLNRGDAFAPASANITINVSGVMLGYYGSGANPTISGNIIVASESAPTSADFKVRKVSISHIDAAAGSVKTFASQMSVESLSFYDCNGAIDFAVGSNLTARWNSRVTDGSNESHHYACRGFFLFECTDSFVGTTGNGSMVFPHFAEKVAFIGNTLTYGGTAAGTEHVIRTDTCYKMAIQHNHTKSPGGPLTGAVSKHHITTRGKGRMDWNISIANMASGGAISGECRYVVIGYNKVGELNEANAWKFSIHPTSEDSNEQISDVICEANTFYDSTAGQVSRLDIQHAGMRLTNRNNTLSADGEGRRPDAVISAGIGQNADYTGPYYWQAKTPSLSDEFASDAMIEPSAPA